MGSALSSTASDAISAPVRVLYEPPIVPGSEKGKSTLRILAIGIADYPEERFKLEYSDDDARTLVATLQEHSKDLFDEIIVVQTLLNAQAKRRAIMDALSNFSKQMSPRDVGVVFYSGHGVQDRFGEFCLFPADGDETAVAETSVPEGFLKNICRTTPGRLLLLLDACHTGAFGGVSDGFVQDISHEQYGVIVMASSAGAEFSLESDEWGHGAFTKSLIEGLTSHGDVNGDGRVFFHELYGYCTDRVPQLTGGRQHPVMAKPLTVHSFALASRPSEVQ